MNTIITISRQYGTGGHEVAEKLALAYDIPLYDKQLIQAACEKSGYSKTVLENLDERKTTSFLYSIALDPWGINEVSGVPLDQKVQFAIRKTILDLSKNGSCVFVGRCADDALTDYDNVLNVFIYADMSYRMERIHKTDYPDISGSKLEKLIHKKDHEREAYHNYYAMTRWGVPESYDICLNSSYLGIDGCVKVIQDIIKDREKNQK